MNFAERINAEHAAREAGVRAQWIEGATDYPSQLRSSSDALRQAQLALQESNERYLDLYDFAPLGYLTLTPGGRVAQANITAASLLGLERQALYEQRFDRFVAAEDRARWQHKFATLMANGGLQGFDLGLACADAAQSATHVQVVCLRIDLPANGEAAHELRMTLVDISEKKRLDDELELHRHHLDALVQARTAELAASRAAAEAAKRAPMNAGQGLTQVLPGSGISAEQRETLGQIEASGSALISLISDVLDLARIDAGQLELERKNFILSEALVSVRALFAERISAKGETDVNDSPGCGVAVSTSADESSENRLRREHCGARILLADDDALTGEVILTMLGGLGLTLDLAGDGVEAMRLAQQNDYALILMDVQMPHMDGLAATRAIRALPRRQATPILAITADVFSESLQACRLAGMNDCLLKPLDPDALFDMLIKWLPC